MSTAKERAIIGAGLGDRVDFEDDFAIVIKAADKGIIDFVFDVHVIEDG